MFLDKISIKLLDFAQKINDWCYEKDDGSNFDRILDLQLRINELRVENELFNDEDYLQ